MATPIPGAYPSPRIDKGVLRWYEGDTFSIVLRFDLKDQDGYYTVDFADLVAQSHAALEAKQ